MTATVAERISKAVGGVWVYNRSKLQWEERGGKQLGDGTRSRRYVVRDTKGLVLYDSSQPNLPGKVI